MASGQKLTWYKQLRGADLTPTQDWLLTLLSTYTNEHGGNAHPGIDRLMADSGLSKSQVHRTLRELEGKGAIAVVQKGGGRLSGSALGAATVYCILIPRQRSNSVESDTVSDTDGGEVTVSSGVLKHQVLYIIRIPLNPRHSLRKRRRAPPTTSTPTNSTSQPSKTN
jgi:hypothetical protein